MMEQIIEAHGGAVRGNALVAIEAEISIRGFLFTAKRVPVLNHVRVRACTREPRFTFFDFPRPGHNSEFMGEEEVRITNGDGKVVARCLQPRAGFRSLRRQFSWDHLDFTYFAGYATWNYLLFPFLFLHDGFQFKVMESLPGASGCGSRLRVTFPDGIPTHCREQIFYFDEQWCLRRLDYTAEVVGRWARATMLCGDYRDFDGFQAPTRRRVLPRLFGNKPLSGPTLVALDIHHIRPLREERRNT